MSGGPRGCTVLYPRPAGGGALLPASRNSILRTLRLAPISWRCHSHLPLRAVLEVGLLAPPSLLLPALCSAFAQRCLLVARPS